LWIELRKEIIGELFVVLGIFRSCFVEVSAVCLGYIQGMVIILSAPTIFKKILTVIF